MADDEAQGQEDFSRPAFDASTDSSLPSASFEPLVWPESRTWDEPPAGEPGAEPLVGAEHPGHLGSGLLFPPTPDDPVLGQAPLPHLDLQWQSPGHDADLTVHHDQALAGLGGGAEAAAPRAEGDMGLISTTALPTPPSYPAAERSSEGPRWRRFDIRQGNAAVVGLITLVSLVLLGMFLSVRARNEVPTDSSQSRRPGDQISVTGSLNTIPLTTTVTTPPAARINIAELLPPVDAGAAAGGDATAADAGSGSGSPVTTAAPSRSGTGSGGGGGPTTAATQPAAKAPAPTSPPATSPTVEDSTPEDTSSTVDTTQPRRPTPTFTFPSFPTTTAPDSDGPSYTIPSRRGTDD